MDLNASQDMKKGIMKKDKIEEKLSFKIVKKNS